MCSITTQRLSSPSAYSEQLEQQTSSPWKLLHPGSAEWPFQTSEGNNYLVTSKMGDGVNKKNIKGREPTQR